MDVAHKYSFTGYAFCVTHWRKFRFLSSPSEPMPDLTISHVFFSAGRFEWHRLRWGKRPPVRHRKEVVQRIRTRDAQYSRASQVSLVLVCAHGFFFFWITYVFFNQLHFALVQRALTFIRALLAFCFTVQFRYKRSRFLLKLKLLYNCLVIQIFWINSRTYSSLLCLSVVLWCLEGVHWFCFFFLGQLCVSSASFSCLD